MTASFALDVMEPHRPAVGRVVLKLITEETSTGADFDAQSSAVCRMNPELSRKMVVVIGVVP